MFSFDVEKFRRERTAQGYDTMDSFAERLRTIIPTASRATVSSWERRRQQPGSKYLFAICEILNKPPEFFERDEKIKKQLRKSVIKKGVMNARRNDDQRRATNATSKR